MYDPIWTQLALFLLAVFLPFMSVSFVWYVVQPAWRRAVRLVVRKRMKSLEYLTDYYRLRVGDSQFEGVTQTWDEKEYKYVTNAELRAEMERLDGYDMWYNKGVHDTPFWVAKGAGVMAAYEPLEKRLPYGHWLRRGAKYVLGERWYSSYRNKPQMPTEFVDVWIALIYYILHNPIIAFVGLQNGLRSITFQIYYLQDPLYVMLSNRVNKKKYWIREVLEVREKTIGKHPSKQKDFGYGGNVPYDDTWRSLRSFGRTRDSEDELNFNYLMTREYLKEHFGDESEDNGWFVERYGHWAVGWVEGFFVQVFHSRKHLWQTKIHKHVLDHLDEDGSLYWLHNTDMWHDVERMTVLHNIRWLDFIDEDAIPEELEQQFTLYEMCHSTNSSLLAGEPDMKFASKDEAEQNILSEMGQYEVPLWTLVISYAGADMSVYFDEGSFRKSEVLEVLATLNWLDWDAVANAYKAQEERKEKWGRNGNSWDDIPDDWAAQAKAVEGHNEWWKAMGVPIPKYLLVGANIREEAQKYMKMLPLMEEVEEKEV